jgi:hypothetical protein
MFDGPSKRPIPKQGECVWALTLPVSKCRYMIWKPVGMRQTNPSYHCGRTFENNKQQQQYAVIKHDEGGVESMPDPLRLLATVRFLQPSEISHQNERYSFFILSLETGPTKGCACVCVGPTPGEATSRNVEVKTT